MSQAVLHKTDMTIKIRCGLEADILTTSPAPYQLEGEPAYATDTKRFFISDGTGFNVLPSSSLGASSTPASASATGTTGEIRWDASYIYICTATDTWKRTAIATW